MVSRAWFGIGLVAGGLLLIAIGVRIIEDWLNKVKYEVVQREKSETSIS